MKNALPVRELTDVNQAAMLPNVANVGDNYDTEHLSPISEASTSSQPGKYNV